ncbi:MAG: metallophosphoesterase, partial [Chloroflexi bacterium]|nr:metallophosphoesterase [Chloroflexota bacterium]
LESWLRFLAAECAMPVYFVLGNHDLYRASRRDVLERVADLARHVADLHWLDGEGAVQLTPASALVGVGGWADGRLGDYQGSRLLMNDYLLIGDFLGLDRQQRLAVMQRWADTARLRATELIDEAMVWGRHILFATHYPPFREACLYRGQPSDDEALPHFASQVMGEALLAAARRWPDRQIDVFCGHTHDRADYRPAPNLRVRAAAAEYGHPGLQMPVIEL